MALGAAAALGLAACGDDTEPDPDSDPITTPEPPDEPDGDDPDDDPGPDPDDDADDPGAAPDPAPEDEVEPVEPLDQTATVDDREQDNDGFGMTISDVRVGTHEGFDRVTVDIEGDGEVGWFASWTDEPILDGSGEVADVEGEAYLTLATRGMALPDDRPEGVTAWDGETVTAPDGAPVLVEAVEGVLFEGQHQVFIGASEEVPFRIERLEDPQRIVIDLVH